nr:multidrug resistance-associated protein 5 [Tanacetum cinerariifolium]
MDLLEYLSQAITYDMDVCVSKTIASPKKRYCNNFIVDEMVDWAEMEVQNQEGVETSTINIEKGIDATYGVEARTSTTDKGKEKVSKDATEVVQTRRSTVEIDTEIEYDSDYQSDKSVDYLSPDEKELIQLRNRIKANRETNAKAKDNPVSKMSEPNNENSMPANNVSGETFEEHDIYMNRLLKSLNTADKDGITEDPFISVEKHMERYPMYDETTHWRLRKAKSGEVMVVAKCGQRPTRLSDPEKGKQRKQTKYPSASSDDLPTCLWRCYTKWMTDEKTFQCISLEDEHTVLGISTLIHWSTISGLVKRLGLTHILDYEKTVGEHYDMLRSYGKEILDSNPGSIVKLGVTVNPGGKTYFDRFYMCFAGLADGWKARCSKIIALDRCFLKRPNQGEILTAIGTDRNNHIYPVAWAVVNVENKDKWTWFFELLEQDLGSSRGNRLTLMSDQHKGLIEVVKDVMPNAEHRQCARHIYENKRK